MITNSLGVSQASEFVTNNLSIVWLGMRIFCCSAVGPPVIDFDGKSGKNLNLSWNRYRYRPRISRKNSDSHILREFKVKQLSLDLQFV
jgi:hypothetical protein